MLSFSEENYLKALYQIAFEQSSKAEAGTNELAAWLQVKPATANDMLKKLKEKKMVSYEKYGKISLTRLGRNRALEIIRKHRLWETFLVEKLEFSWDEVHEVAEQMEHIHSAKLIDKIDKLLNYPLFDPHGDAIPNAKGEVVTLEKRTLAEEKSGHKCKMVAVKDNSAQFLQYLDKVGLGLQSMVKFIARHDYDNLFEIEIKGQRVMVGPRFAENVVVVCEKCSAVH